MKRVISVFLVMFLVVCISAAPIMAETNSAPDNSSIRQTFTMSGSDASYGMLNQIKEAGVPVTDESEIRLVPLHSMNEGGETGKGALVVSNEEGNTITKNILLLVTDDGVGFEEGDNASTRAGSTVDFPPLSWDGRYVIQGTAVYNVYSSSYYQPMGAYFTYKKYKTCTVSNITLKYICDGFEYSYPGLKDLGLPELEYVITVTKSSPVESTMYSTMRQYNTSRAIYTGSGSPFVGQFLTFNTTVDGKSDGYTVQL